MDSGLPVISSTRDASLTLRAYTCEDLGEKGDLCLSRYIPALGLVSPTRTILYVPTLSVACRPTLACLDLMDVYPIKDVLGVLWKRSTRCRESRFVLRDLRQ